MLSVKKKPNFSVNQRSKKVFSSCPTPKNLRLSVNREIIHNKTDIICIMNLKLHFILELLGAATLRSVITGEFYTLGGV